LNALKINIPRVKGDVHANKLKELKTLHITHAFNQRILDKYTLDNYKTPHIPFIKEASIRNQTSTHSTYLGTTPL
jgi:hypothetical protein